MEAKTYSIRQGFKSAVMLAMAGMLGALIPQVHAHSEGGSHQHHGRGHHDHQQAHPHASQHFPDASKAAAPLGVRVEECWIRAMPNRLPSAGYFLLHNGGDKSVALIGAQAEGFDKVMLHASETQGGMSTMVHVHQVDIAPGKRIEFAPGGHHIMLEKPTLPLDIGSQRPITLWFEGGQAVTVRCDIRPPSTLPNRR